MKSAISLSNKMISDDSINLMTEIIGSNEVILVPVLAREKLGNNKIPLAFAKHLGEILNCELSTDITQANSPQRTGENAEYRLKNQPIFSGKIIENASYIIVDDHLSSGATIANLKGHIENNKGLVIATTTLSSYNNRIVPDKKALNILKGTFGKNYTNEYVNKIISKEFNHGFSWKTLTRSELSFTGKQLSKRYGNSLIKGEKKNVNDILQMDVRAGKNRKAELSFKISKKQL